LAAVHEESRSVTATSQLSRDRTPVARLNGTVVCVVDAADAEEAALDVGKGLAERFDARVVLVGIAAGAGGSADGLHAVHARAGMARRLQRLAVEYGLDDAEQRLASGDTAEAVATIAAEEAADVIVVGARPGLRTQTLRSTLASDLAATTMCPVVVAPPRRR
jgi:nucleotide-binding universal stress UspA family protein